MEARIINAAHTSVKEYWLQFRKYKRLIWIFAWQEIKAQYAQTYLGILWIVLRPLIILSIFTILFGYLLKIKTSAPYYLFAFAGLIAWNYFSQIISAASTAIVQNQYLIRRMYFPKLILPLSKTLVASVEALVSLILIFALIIFTHYSLSLRVLAMPLFIFLNICCGFMIAIWMNVLNFTQRDLQQIITPLISMGIWVTPVFFPVTIIPEKYHFLMYFNPMAGIIEGYRYALLNEPFPDFKYWICFSAVLILTAVGLRYLIYREDEVVDYV